MRQNIDTVSSWWLVAPPGTGSGSEGRSELHLGYERVNIPCTLFFYKKVFYQKMRSDQIKKKTSGSRHYRPTPSSAYGIHLYPYPYPYPHPYPYPYPYPYIHIHTSDTDTDTDTDTDVYPDTDTDTDTDTDVYP